MISRAPLSRIDRKAPAGRTVPIRGAIEFSGTEVEVYVKLSIGCEQGAINLAREAIAACLASDLGLPVPRPWLVEIPKEILPAIVQKDLADRFQHSIPVAFGSTAAPGFFLWTQGHKVSPVVRPIAASALLFDAIIQNPDRRAENSNCLVRGDELRLIDHELAFAHRVILGWTPPWKLGGMKELETPGRHIFVKDLKGVGIDWKPIKSQWASLPVSRLQEYASAIPPEWAGAKADVETALKLIADAGANIDGCIAELERVLA